MSQPPIIVDTKRQGICDVVRGEGDKPLERVCFRPAVLRYPAMGGGYMRLCAEHGEKHRQNCGEWTGDHWTASPWEQDWPEHTEGPSR